MTDLFAVLVPILLVDVLNPVLFAMLVFAAGSGRPVGNSSAVLAGHTLAYFVAGVAIAHGMEQISDLLTAWSRSPIASRTPNASISSSAASSARACS